MAREEIIGSPRRNLVLQTTGGIRVKVGDKYYRLKYSEEEETSENTEEKASNFMVVDSIADYESGIIAYPGDEIVIFSIKEAKLYYTLDGLYHEYGETSDVTSSVEDVKEFDSTVLFNGDPPFQITTNTLIPNLNAEFLNGKTAEDFLTKGDSVVYESIRTKDGAFNHSDGVTTIDNAKINNLSVDNLNSNINIGVNANILDSDETVDSMVNRRGVNPITILYDAFLVGITDKLGNSQTDFTALCKELLKPVSPSTFKFPNPTLDTPEKTEYYNKTLAGITEIVYEITSESTWDKYVSENKSLLSILRNSYFTESLSAYNGTVFLLTSDNPLPIGLTGQTQLIEEKENGDSVTHLINYIVSGVEEDYVYITTDFKTEVMSSANINKVVSEISITYETTELAKFDIIVYEQSDSYKGIYSLDLESVEIKNGTIGNLNSVEDPTFGALEGFGLYSKNATLINPNIACINSDGINYVTINSNPSVEVNLDMCVFTIGSGDSERKGKITVDESGVLKFTDI